MPQSALAHTRLSPGVVLVKAVLNAADRLNVSARRLAAILGVSEATVSRMRTGGYSLVQGQKPFELGTLFVRLYRSLDAITGGDEAVARAWLANHNIALDGYPLERIQTITGLTDVLAYLDARRALV